jgi:hypothetical protein
MQSYFHIRNEMDKDKIPYFFRMGNQFYGIDKYTIRPLSRLYRTFMDHGGSFSGDSPGSSEDSITIRLMKLDFNYDNTVPYSFDDLVDYELDGVGGYIPWDNSDVSVYNDYIEATESIGPFKTILIISKFPPYRIMFVTELLSEFTLGGGGKLTIEDLYSSRSSGIKGIASSCFVNLEGRNELYQDNLP